MNAVTMFGVCGAVIVGLGLYGLIVHQHLLRKIVALNVLSAGVFLLFGVIARRGALGSAGSDPVPQALVITGLVVAFAGTALAVTLLVRLVELTGGATLDVDTDSNTLSDAKDGTDS